MKIYGKITSLVRALPALAAIILVAGCLMVSCGNKSHRIENFCEPVYTPQYAIGFQILGETADSTAESGNVLLLTRTPWQGGEGEETALLVLRDSLAEAPDGYGGQVLRGEPRRIVCMSSSHVAMLDALGATDRIVGVSGKDFITNEKLRSRFGEIGDVGYENDINYEVLVALRPDLVTFYGLNGANPMEAKLRELRIPYVYIGEYLEESPLGKAEWLVAMGEIIGCRKAAEEWFAPLPERYNTLKEKAQATTDRPTVMLNTPYGDSWVMPSTSSYIAQLISDAGGQYAYSGNSTSESLPIDIEEAYFLASKADLWMNSGRFYTLGDLRAAFPKFADVPSVRHGRVWNNGKRLSPSGGNDFWESGALHPDLVLEDYIRIIHPGLLPDSTLNYYQKLR